MTFWFKCLKSMERFIKSCAYMSIKVTEELSSQSATTGAGIAYPSGASKFTTGFGFCGVRVAQSLVFYVDHYLSFVLFVFGHFIVCPILVICFVSSNFS